VEVIIWTYFTDYLLDTLQQYLPHICNHICRVTHLIFLIHSHNICGSTHRRFSSLQWRTTPHFSTTHTSALRSTTAQYITHCTTWWETTRFYWGRDTISRTLGRCSPASFYIRDTLFSVLHAPTWSAHPPHHATYGTASCIVPHPQAIILYAHPSSPAPLTPGSSRSKATRRSFCTSSTRSSPSLRNAGWSQKGDNIFYLLPFLDICVCLFCFMSLAINQ
jgi:hypothetical protein